MTYKEIAAKTTLADGVSLSIPRENVGPYAAVEVGFIEDKKRKPVTPPRTWKQYADGSFPNDVYGYVPVALVERFIKRHGGVKKGPGIP